MKLISVQVNDPDHEPFVAHLPMTWPDDLPAALRDQTRILSAAQLGEAAGRELDEVEARALGVGFLSALVHDVAVVHGMLARLGCELPAEADDGALFDSGRGVQLGFALPGGGRVTMTHLNPAGVPDYTERVTVFCADRIIELEFPSPYLRHLPTRLTIRRGGDEHALEVRDLRTSYEEAFREELRAFHAAATGEAPVQTTVEQARRDIELLTSAFRWRQDETGIYSDLLPQLERRAMFAWCRARRHRRRAGRGRLGPLAASPSRPRDDRGARGARSPGRRTAGARTAARAVNAAGNLLHPDPARRGDAQARLRAAVDLAVALGVPRVVTMSGCPAGPGGGSLGVFPCWATSR